MHRRREIESTASLQAIVEQREIRQLFSDAARGSNDGSLCVRLLLLQSGESRGMCMQRNHGIRQRLHFPRNQIESNMARYGSVS